MQLSYPFVPSIFSSSSSPPHPFHTTPAFSLGSQWNFQPERFLAAAVKLKFHVWWLPSCCCSLEWLRGKVKIVQLQGKGDMQQPLLSTAWHLWNQYPSIKFGQKCPLMSKATEIDSRAASVWCESTSQPPVSIQPLAVSKDKEIGPMTFQYCQRHRF